MIAPRQIVEVIQALPPTDANMRFLISLANNAFKYGDLTEKQTMVFQSIVERKREEGVLA